MRTIFIGDVRIFDISKAQLSQYYDIYIGYDAYRLLLEIVSGIRSRLLGETEVLAQFKEITNNEALPENSLGDYTKRLRDQIIEDSRKIRSGHLRFLGDQSYGGLANRYLKSTKEVTLYGTGNLSLKVLPWLMGNNRKVTVVGRNVNKLNEIAEKYSVETKSLKEIPPDTEAVVIAAPISFTNIIPNLKRNTTVVDFREDDMDDQFPNSINYISFESILNSLKAQEERNKELRITLETVVSEIVEERENASQNFLYGWEDIPCLAH